MTYVAVKHRLADDEGVDDARGDWMSDPLGAEVSALRAAADVISRAPDAVRSESASVLREVLAMDRAGDLPTAILLLAYDEAYRDDLEALKRRCPTACTDFVERYALRPF